MKLGIFTLPPGIKSFFEAVDFAKEHGIGAIEPYNGLEFARPDLESARRLAEYAGQQGIDICCFSMEANVAGEDNRAEIKKLKEYAAVAAALGAPYFHHTILSGLSHKFPRLPFSKLLERAVSSVREIYDHAEQLGVKCAYEDQGFVFNGRQRFERFLEAVNRPVSVVADLGNIYFVGERIEDFVGCFAPFIDHVHVKDYLLLPGDQARPDKSWHLTRDGSYLRDCIMGHGTVPFEKVFRILGQAGYDGTYSLEYCGLEEPARAIKESVANLQLLYKRSRDY
jgi:sugar phosphate isomerase/epimerase